MESLYNFYTKAVIIYYSCSHITINDNNNKQLKALVFKALKRW